MNAGDPMILSLGEWVAMCDGWERANGKSTVSAPSDEEFAAAIAAEGG